MRTIWHTEKRITNEILGVEGLSDQSRKVGEYTKRSWGLCKGWPHPLHPLHPNISVHILHTVTYTFPKVLMRKICSTIKSSFSWWSFPLFSWSQINDLGVLLSGETRCLNYVFVQQLPVLSLLIWIDCQKLKLQG